MTTHPALHVTPLALVSAHLVAAHWHQDRGRLSDTGHQVGLDGLVAGHAALHVADPTPLTAEHAAAHVRAAAAFDPEHAPHDDPRGHRALLAGGIGRVRAAASAAAASQATPEDHARYAALLGAVLAPDRVAAACGQLEAALDDAGLAGEPDGPLDPQALRAVFDTLFPIDGDTGGGIVEGAVEGASVSAVSGA